MERDELIKQYNLDVVKLESEQVKLAKQLDVKDFMDFGLAEKFAAFDNSFVGNKILSSVIVVDKDFEVIEKSYAFEKVDFPYLSGFRAYRELPGMMKAFEKLQEKPDLVFVSGQGIIHERLGIASHFSLVVGVPSIGVSNSLVGCEVEGDDILKKGKKVGKVLVGKPGSRPLYVSPGNGISIKTSYDFVKNFIKLPHKLPEPMHLAGKYNREIRKEILIS